MKMITKSVLHGVWCCLRKPLRQYQATSLAVVLAAVLMASSIGTVQAFEYDCVECECVPAPRGPLIPPYYCDTED